MRNLLLIVLVLILLGGGGFYAYNAGMFDFSRSKTEEVVGNTNSVPPKELLYNMEYTADGEKFSITNGMGASEGNTLKIIDQPVFGDLNRDGKDDAALWLLKEAPGNVKEYYATVSINEGDKYKSEDSILLGTNLTPENIVIVENQAVYQYESVEGNKVTQGQTTITYDTNNNQLSTAPSVDTNPAISANPAIEDLTGRDWQWINTTYADSSAQTAVPLTRLTLRLDTNGTFAASTDCSGIGGRYEINNKDIVFSEMPGTLLYCGGIEDKDFRRALKEVVALDFNSKGNLLLNLKNNSGVMNFK